MRVRLKPFDIAGIAVSVGIVLASFFLVYSGGSGAARVEVSAPGGEWVYALDEDRHLDFPGPLGVTTVEIRDGAVRISSSPCPNQPCVASGAVSKPGQWIACLPNKILVRIEGSGEEEGVDAAVF
jgi:hypothetical protein